MTCQAFSFKRILRVEGGGLLKVVTQVREGNLAWSDRVLVR